MPRRPLPTPAEAAAILARKRTRPAYKPPRPVGRSLSRLVKALDERFGQGADGLKTRWREIAGEVLAARSEPVKIIKGRNGSGGVLELRVDGPAATLIQHQTPEIIARANLMLGAGAVERLRIVQGPVRAPLKPRTPPRPRKPPPLDAAREAELEQGLAGAPEDLKSALLKLGREVLRRDPPR
ncbi:MAG: DUF721 domain-containing protein [Caulobacteraceae bacterium]